MSGTTFASTTFRLTLFISMVIRALAACHARRLLPRGKMSVRGDGEAHKQEEEFRQDVEMVVRRLLTQDAINTMGRGR